MTSGTIYLICAALGALNTANAWRPFARDGRLSLVFYLAGMLTSELPLQTIAWQVLATVGFAFAGAFGSVTGLVGLALSVLSWVVLVALYRVAQRAGDVFDAALRPVLGANATVSGERKLTVREIAIPGRGSRKRYCATRDVPYADGGVRNQLDVWRRPDLPTDGNAPVVLQVHGGAWSTGRKDFDAGPLLTHLSEQGWVCVAMNYRLSPAATWPDHIVDVKRAIAWIRQNIGEYGGDSSFVAITGGSSGGHLSALAALSANDPAFQPGFEDVDTTVQAAAPMYGLFDLTNRVGSTRKDTMDFLAKKVFKTSREEDVASWEAGSPLCRIRPDAPPFLITHGTNDSFLPVEQARAFAAALGEQSQAPVVFAELPHTQHGFDPLSSVRVLHLTQAVERFLTFAHETHESSPPSGSSA